ncbi:hypothetical protein CMU89_10220 [Elizabethkingia anophelis]|nr:hypothetical protein [Elizabethkingia anophelis]MDV3543025.1 hypothetical protein [Elizabethkingia anophelis]
MKNLIKKLSVGIFAVAFTMGFGQKIDANAKTILDGVSTNYKSKKNNYFKFVYRNGSGTAGKAVTGIFYSAGSKYKLNIMGTEQIFDGNKVYSISGDDKEVTIAKPTGSETMFSPLNYIDSYKNGYTVQYMGKKNVGGINADYIKMTPVSNNGIKYVNLFVNSAKKQLVKLEQFSENNKVAVIEISKYIENQNLSPSTFTFNKANYKNYLITEL